MDLTLSKLIEDIIDLVVKWLEQKKATQKPV